MKTINLKNNFFLPILLIFILKSSVSYGVIEFSRDGTRYAKIENGCWPGYYRVSANARKNASKYNGYKLNYNDNGQLSLNDPQGQTVVSNIRIRQPAQLEAYLRAIEEELINANKGNRDVAQIDSEWLESKWQPPMQAGRQNTGVKTPQHVPGKPPIRIPSVEEDRVQGELQKYTELLQLFGLRKGSVRSEYPLEYSNLDRQPVERYETTPEYQDMVQSIMGDIGERPWPADIPLAPVVIKHVAAAFPPGLRIEGENDSDFLARIQAIPSQVNDELEKYISIVQKSRALGEDGASYQTEWYLNARDAAFAGILSAATVPKAVETAVLQSLNDAQLKSAVINNVATHSVLFENHPLLQDFAVLRFRIVGGLLDFFRGPEVFIRNFANISRTALDEVSAYGDKLINREIPDVDKWKDAILRDVLGTLCQKASLANKEQIQNEVKIQVHESFNNYGGYRQIIEHYLQSSTAQEFYGDNNQDFLEFAVGRLPEELGRDTNPTSVLEFLQDPGEQLALRYKDYLIENEVIIQATAIPGIENFYLGADNPLFERGLRNLSDPREKVAMGNRLIGELMFGMKQEIMQQTGYDFIKGNATEQANIVRKFVEGQIPSLIAKILASSANADGKLDDWNWYLNYLREYSHKDLSPADMLKVWGYFLEGKHVITISDQSQMIRGPGTEHYLEFDGDYNRLKGKEMAKKLQTHPSLRDARFQLPLFSQQLALTGNRLRPYDAAKKKELPFASAAGHGAPGALPEPKQPINFKRTKPPVDAGDFPHETVKGAKYLYNVETGTVDYILYVTQDNLDVYTKQLHPENSLWQVETASTTTRFGQDFKNHFHLYGPNVLKEPRVQIKFFKDQQELNAAFAEGVKGLQNIIYPLGHRPAAVVKALADYTDKARAFTADGTFLSQLMQKYDISLGHVGVDKSFEVRDAGALFLDLYKRKYNESPETIERVQEIYEEWMNAFKTKTAPRTLEIAARIIDRQAGYSSSEVGPLQLRIRTKIAEFSRDSRDKEQLNQKLEKAWNVALAQHNSIFQDTFSRTDRAPTSAATSEAPLAVPRPSSGRIGGHSAGEKGANLAGRLPPQLPSRKGRPVIPGAGRKRTTQAAIPDGRAAPEPLLQSAAHADRPPVAPVTAMRENPRELPVIAEGARVRNPDGRPGRQGDSELKKRPSVRELVRQFEGGAKE